MSDIKKLLKQIADLGFIINKNNETVEIESDIARDYFNENFITSSFILGNVPVGTDNLDFVEYDVAFVVIEDNASELTEDQYNMLHEKAKINNLELFIKVVEDSNIEVGLMREIIDDIESWLEDITYELEEIIKHLTIGNVGNENGIF